MAWAIFKFVLIAIFLGCNEKGNCVHQRRFSFHGFPVVDRIMQGRHLDGRGHLLCTGHCGLNLYCGNSLFYNCDFIRDQTEEHFQFNTCGNCWRCRQQWECGGPRPRPPPPPPPRPPPPPPPRPPPPPPPRPPPPPPPRPTPPPPPRFTPPDCCRADSPDLSRFRCEPSLCRSTHVFPIPPNIDWPQIPCCILCSSGFPAGSTCCGTVFCMVPAPPDLTSEEITPPCCMCRSGKICCDPGQCV